MSNVYSLKPQKNTLFETHYQFVADLGVFLISPNDINIARKIIEEYTNKIINKNEQCIQYQRDRATRS